jgi:hypothetical protein
MSPAASSFASAPGGHMHWPRSGGGIVHAPSLALGGGGLASAAFPPPALLRVEAGGGGLGGQGRGDDEGLNPGGGLVQRGGPGIDMPTPHLLRHHGGRHHPRNLGGGPPAPPPEDSGSEGHASVISIGGSVAEVLYVGHAPLFTAADFVDGDGI